MSITLSAAEILKRHVTLEVESIDRMYLNVFVPILQSEGGVSHFFRKHRGKIFASSALMKPMTEAFIKGIEKMCSPDHIPLITFERKQSKEDVAAGFLKNFVGSEGFLFVGKAQEKTKVYGTTTRTNPQTGQKFPWINRSTQMPNHYYFYAVDEDFGMFFLKFCSYFPYNGKLCFNVHEYAKRQLRKRKIGFEELDNGFLSCENPAELQKICDSVTDDTIQALFLKWLHRIPLPFTREDREAGFRHTLSILQAEFCLTQVFDRPALGRHFFENIIRDNLDLGAPGNLQLIFNRRVTRRTPGRFRTRFVTDGVTPYFSVSYKHSLIKQYFKLLRALRTECVINNTRDFGIGKRLHNLAKLREVGFQANRRLLDVQRTSHDCAIGEDAFQKVQQKVEVNGQQGSGLRYGDPRVQALFGAVIALTVAGGAISRKQLREHFAHLLGQDPQQIKPGTITYHLRRLRLHGIIERVPHRNQYRFTQEGLRTALFFSRTYNCLMVPGLASLHEKAQAPNSGTASKLNRVTQAVSDLCQTLKLSA